MRPYYLLYSAVMRNNLETAAVIMEDGCRIWWPSTAVSWRRAEKWDRCRMWGLVQWLTLHETLTSDHKITQDRLLSFGYHSTATSMGKSGVWSEGKRGGVKEKGSRRNDRPNWSLERQQTVRVRQSEQERKKGGTY